MPLLPLTTAARRTPAPASAVRAGFSLVELLVVLGIIAAMAGMVLGGLFRSRDGNRLLAAEQVLADAIRQGRHTARSTGAPVELRLTPVLSGTEVVGAKLAGVSRVVLWSETFDRVRDLNNDGVIDQDDDDALPMVTTETDGVVIGRTGNGRRPSDTHRVHYELERGATIVRAGRTEGFYLACSVQPPVAQTEDVIIPLVLISSSLSATLSGGTSPNEFDGTYDGSQCGLALQSRKVTIQAGQSEVLVWDLVGWVFGEGNQHCAINSTLDPVASRLGREPLNEDDDEAVDPVFTLIGGRWIDVGLLYDGQRMILYCDGRRVAEYRGTAAMPVPGKLRALTDGFNDPPDPGVRADHVHVGSMLVPANGSTPQSWLHSSAPLDDVRLYRLGTSEVTELPGNIILVDGAGSSQPTEHGWRILCQPDGRVEVTRENDPAPVNDRVAEITPGPRAGDRATIILGQLRAAGTLQNAELKVTLDGRVLSRLITAPIPVPPDAKK